MLVKEVQRTRELAADSASATSNQFEKMKASLSATHDRERVLREQLEVARSMASLSCASSIAPSPDPLKHSPMVSFREREMDHDRIKNLESQLANQKLKTREAEAKLQQHRTAPITPPVTAASCPVVGVISKGDFFGKLAQQVSVSPNAVQYFNKITEADPTDAPLEYETMLTEIATNWNQLGEKPPATEDEIKAAIIASLTDQGVPDDMLAAAQNCGSVSEVLQMLSHHKQQSTGSSTFDPNAILEVLGANGVPQHVLDSLSPLSGEAFFVALAGAISRSGVQPKTKSSVIENARSKGVPEHVISAVEQSSADETVCIEQVLSNLTDSATGNSTESCLTTCLTTLSEHNVSEVVVNSVRGTERNTVDIHQTLIKLSSVVTGLQSGTTEFVNKSLLIQKAKEQGIADENLADIESAADEAISAVDLLKNSKNCSKAGLQRSLQGKVSDGILAEIDQLSDSISYEDVIIKLATLVDISSSTTVNYPGHNNNVQDNPPETAKSSSLENETRNLIDGNWVRGYDPDSSMFYYMTVDGSQEGTWYCPPEFDINRAVLQEEVAQTATDYTDYAAGGDENNDQTGDLQHPGPHDPEAGMDDHAALGGVALPTDTGYGEDGAGGDTNDYQTTEMYQQQPETDPEGQVTESSHPECGGPEAGDTQEVENTHQQQATDAEAVGEHAHEEAQPINPMNGEQWAATSNDQDGNQQPEPMVEQEVQQPIDPEDGPSSDMVTDQQPIPPVEEDLGTQELQCVHQEPLPQDDSQQPPPTFDPPTDPINDSICEDGQHTQEEDEITWPIGTKARLEAVQETIRKLLPPDVSELEFFGKPPETIEAKEARLMASSPDARKAAPTISQHALLGGEAELCVGADMFSFD
eukprot:TRINITY_DN9003_c0_g2_i1.p1 TRINITY_DN9003_c0_g2~~TRINITY_DN9003_c0_g2_i1.p1  ORF type:complete len:953 (+),score=233.63 TRINITY_DN9003_c0_g2_i1:248-2860(+)